MKVNIKGVICQHIVHLSWYVPLIKNAYPMTWPDTNFIIDQDHSQDSPKGPKFISENTGKLLLRDLATLTNNIYCNSQRGALMNRFPVMMTPIGWREFPTIFWSGWNRTLFPRELKSKNVEGFFCCKSGGQLSIASLKLPIFWTFHQKGGRLWPLRHPPPTDYSPTGKWPEIALVFPHL